MPDRGQPLLERLPPDVGVVPAAREPADVDHRVPPRRRRGGRRARRGPPAVADGEQHCSYPVVRRAVSDEGRRRRATDVAVAAARDAGAGRRHVAGFRQLLPDARLAAHLRRPRRSAESTAGLVTAVFLLVTILLQGTLPALTARFGAPRVLVGGPARHGPALAALRRGRRARLAVRALGGARRGLRRPHRARLDAGRAGRAAGATRGVDRHLRAGDRGAEPGRRPGRGRAGAGRARGGLAWLAASPLLGILFVPVLARAVAGRADGDRRRAPAGPPRWRRCCRRPCCSRSRWPGAASSPSCRSSGRTAPSATDRAAPLRRHRRAEPLARGPARGPARRPACSCRCPSALRGRHGARWRSGWAAGGRRAAPRRGRHGRRLRGHAEPHPAGGLRAGRRDGHDVGQRGLERRLRLRHRRRRRRPRVSSPPAWGCRPPMCSSAVLLVFALPLAVLSRAARPTRR